MKVNSGFFWESAVLLACTEALSTLRVGGSSNSPTLVPRDLKKRPLKNSMQKTEHPDQLEWEHMKMQICWCTA